MDADAARLIAGIDALSQLRSRSLLASPFPLILRVPKKKLFPLLSNVAKHYTEADAVNGRKIEDFQALIYFNIVLIIARWEFWMLTPAFIASDLESFLHFLGRSFNSSTIAPWVKHVQAVSSQCCHSRGNAS